eukprot:CAMPEP_0181313066 /NCGR_PEP_ID=MMETSP1101-20121128/14046_1 /TAXON_ID=46948 /ORGANISM="Rhodomonas abbreviata, Strain Caron Lab Isolate" /LENGTH=188 /DNA_ID=CAMNT_0023419987 /DNA_START=111 /DNA_END=677 /DNA_ORIENTATION=-
MSRFAAAPRLRGGSAVNMKPTVHSISMGLGVGDSLDKGLELFAREDGKMNTYTTEKLFGGKKSVIFAVPGAFTPTCSEKHLPSFINLNDDLKAAGVEVVACVSVNDPFVMAEWGKAQKVDGKVMMLSDGNGKFSESIGQLVDKGGPMGMRSNRYAMVLDKDMKVELMALEDGGYGKTSAEAVLEFLKK